MSIIHTEVLVGTDHMETVSMGAGGATDKKREVVCIGSPDSAGIDKIADIGQSTMANSLPVAIASDQSAVPVSGSVAVSNLPATQPVSATALPLPSGTSTSAKQPALGTAGTPSADVITIQGAPSMTPVKVDGSGATQPVSAASLPLPSGAATSAKQPALGTAGTPSADVVTVQGAASMTPLKVDASATTQPVSAASLPLPTGAAQDATMTGGTAKAITRGGQKGTTNTNADITHTPSGANHEAMDVVLYDAAGNQIGLSGAPVRVDPTGTTAQPVSQNGTWTVQPGNTPNTTPWVITGSKTNNNAAPGATNFGTLPAIANAAPQSLTEGNQAAVSVDLKGNLRVYGHPPDVLGAYMVNGRTGTYSGQVAGAPLFSFRWSDATRLAVIMRVSVMVATTTAATVAGNVERELVVARGFTASDTGGTAVVLTGNNQKMRTSQGASLVADMRFGQPLTAGTRTLDSAPLSSVIAWLPLQFLGYDIGSGATVAPSAASAGMGGLGFMPLLNATTGQDYPLVLAQNEGFIVRIGKDAQPTSAVQQTYVQISWAEVNAF